MTPNLDKKLEWEKEFDKKFVDIISLEKENTACLRNRYMANDIKSFIKSLLSQHTERMVQKLEGMKKTKCGLGHDWVEACHDCDWISGRNQALDEAIRTIKE